jgi:hypothetical protein
MVAGGLEKPRPAARRAAILLGRRDIVATGQMRKVVSCAVAMLGARPPAALARRLVAEHMVGRRPDAQRILPGLQICHSNMQGTGPAGDHLEADAEPVIDYRDRHPPGALQPAQPPDLLMETACGAQRPVADLLLLVVRTGMCRPPHP